MLWHPACGIVYNMRYIYDLYNSGQTHPDLYIHGMVRQDDELQTDAAAAEPVS